MPDILCVRRRNSSAQSADSAAPPAPPSTPQADPDAAALDRPRKKLKPDQFFAAIAAYKPADATCSYIYRRWPVIDKKLTGGEDAVTYIDKVAGAIDRAYIVRTWGSGEYRIRFVDENAPRGQNEVCNAILTIEEQDAPPVLDTRELVLGHPQNAGYVEQLRLRGLLPKPKEEVGVQPETAELARIAGDVIRGGLQQRRSDPAEAAMSKSFDLLAEGAKRAIDLAGGGKNQADPVELFLRMREATKGDSDMIRLLLDSQSKQFNLMLELMKQQQRPPESSLEAQLASFERLSRLFDKFSGRGSASSPFWDALAGVLPGALGLIGSIAASRAGVPADQIAAAAAPAMVPNPDSGGASPMLMLPPFVVNQVAAQILSSLASGVGGDDFAESLSQTYGEAIYDQVAARGKAEILKQLERATAWPQLAARRAELEQFIDDFLAWGRPDDPAAAGGLQQVA